MPEVLAVGLSLSDQAQTVGAIAGFAAILGLAILSLLYFAQARELKRLREWAGRSPERAAEIEQQVAAGAPRRVVTPAGAARPAAATPAGQAVKAPPPGTPARTAAATAAGAAAGAAAAATPGAAPAATPGAATPKPGTPPVVPGAAPTVPAPAAATPAAAAEGDTTVQPVATPAPTGIPPAAAPSGLAAPVAPAPIPVPARPAQPLRAAAGATRSVPATPPGGRPTRRDGTRRGESESRFSRTTALVAGAILLVLIAGIFLATQIGGSDKKVAAKPNTVGTAVTTTGANGKKTTASTTASSSPVDKSNTTVAVLNGTTVTGLANTVADKVTGAGYKKGAVTNAADQQRSATAVAYAPGHQAEGEAVAKLIGVGADAVAPLDETTAAIAGTNATVVVTVGSDQKPQ